MQNGAFSPYRNLKNMNQDEWQHLDIHLFIAANFNRYCGALLKKIGYQHLPSDAANALMGLYCDVGFKPLSSVHAKNLDAAGERRNQIMLGTLKMISATRMVDAIIGEFPAYLSLENMVNGSSLSSNQDEQPLFGQRRETATLQEETNFFATEVNLMLHEEVEEEKAHQEQRTSMMIEMLRPRFTQTQYEHLRYFVCDRLDCNEIAARTGNSVTNVRVMLLNARRRMLELMPPDVAENYKDCVYRK